MEQLLEFNTIPISIELKIVNAKREIKTEPVGYEMTRDPGTFQVSHQYPRLNIDTFETRASMNFKSVSRSVKDYADDGMQAVYEAISNTMEEGKMLLNIQKGSNPLSDIAFQRVQSTLDTMLGFTPSVPADIKWEPHQLSMQYEMDRLNFDWRTSKPKVEYTPARIEYLIKEYPKLEIKYKGKPLYVPPSAEPGYEPKEFNVTA